MDNITKTMLSCEDIAGQIADNFRNIGKEMQSIKIMDLLAKELVYIDDIATLGIKEAILKRTASNMEIIQTFQDMIRDGYKGLSLNLTNLIKDF